jgi:hypothetical protein
VLCVLLSRVRSVVRIVGEADNPVDSAMASEAKVSGAVDVFMVSFEQIKVEAGC